MGKVYKPEDLTEEGKKVPDIKPAPIPRPFIPTNLEAVLQEIRSLKLEIERIKSALRRHGIVVE
ncbi:MAG: hypothetical protein ACE5GD_04960 [Candidatus Geothermarchaeales archaeon]